jgi:hypothetical protein
MFESFVVVFLALGNPGITEKVQAAIAAQEIDWVQYYKSSSYTPSWPGTNGGSSRIQFAPVFVSPTMQWAVPNTMLSGPPQGPGLPPPYEFPEYKPR